MTVTPDQAAMGAYDAHLDREEQDLRDDLWAAEWYVEDNRERLEDEARDEEWWT